jgi:hypothetical protein
MTSPIRELELELEVTDAGTHANCIMPVTDRGRKPISKALIALRAVALGPLARQAPDGNGLSMSILQTPTPRLRLRNLSWRISEESVMEVRPIAAPINGLYTLLSNLAWMSPHMYPRTDDSNVEPNSDTKNDSCML